MSNTHPRKSIPFSELIKELELLNQPGAEIVGFSVTAKMDNSSINLKWGDLKVRKQASKPN